MLIVVGVFSVIVRLINLMDFSSSVVASFLMSTANSLFILALVATMIYSTVLVIIRYVKSLYRDQGYLTHTLPVSKHQLLLSQLLVAVIMTSISVLVILVAVFIAYFVPNWIEGIRAFFEGFFNMSLPNIRDVILIILTLIMGSLQSIFVIYFGISLGHASNKNKTLLSVVYCIALNYGISIVLSILQFPFVRLLTEFYALMSFYCVSSVVVCVACYFLTIFMMKKHLNLE